MDERQMRRFRRALEEKEQRVDHDLVDPGEMAAALAHERQLFAHERPPDVTSPRAKSTGHGKKTADKWNQ
jgi:hypothetical protein